jgi:uncharacterized OsmC-like protein
MKIQAHVFNAQGEHKVDVATDGTARTIVIPPKTVGQGSSINGGELLLLALATCYCNDIYREAAKRNIAVKSVDATVHGKFDREGDPARNVRYTANVIADASKEAIDDLLKQTDRVAEIHNTLRVGTPVVYGQAPGKDL